MFNFINILILSPSNIDYKELLHQICANPFDGQKGSAGVLLGAGGKPSTWFPPGGLVEQDLTGVVFPCVKENLRKNDQKNDQNIKVLEFDGDSNPLDEISKF